MFSWCRCCIESMTSATNRKTGRAYQFDQFALTRRETAERGSPVSGGCDDDWAQGVGSGLWPDR